jgi:hypothetical protein
MSPESQFDGNLETFHLNVPSKTEKQVGQIRGIMQKASQGRYVMLIDVVSRSENKRPPTLYPGHVRVTPIDVVDIKYIFSIQDFHCLLVNLVAGS